MRRFIGARTVRFLAIVGISIPILAFVLQNAGAAGERHVHAKLASVAGSSVHGQVDLTALDEGGTRIRVVAQGLEPGETYVSLYYDGHECELEPYDEEIGGEYTANAGGVGTVSGTIDDDLDEVNSVSVRLASDFSLLACADVHPEGSTAGHK